MHKLGNTIDVILFNMKKRRIIFVYSCLEMTMNKIKNKKMHRLGNTINVILFNIKKGGLYLCIRV